MNLDRGLPRKLRRQLSLPSNVAEDRLWCRCGRPVVYLLLFLMACWAILAQFKGLSLCSSTVGTPLQHTDGSTSPKSINDHEANNLRAKTIPPANPAGGPASVSTEFIRSLFNQWNDALLTGDPDQVTRRYATRATLLPTLSNVPRNDYASIKDYFDMFLSKQPKGRIVEGTVQLGDGGSWAQDNGIYEFELGIDGSVVRARYSFVYQLLQEDGDHEAEWKIIHHHSSLMPET